MNLDGYNNPGEKVNRPRYTCDLIIVIILVMVSNFYASLMRDEWQWYGLDINLVIDLDRFLKIVGLLRFFDVEVRFNMREEFLKRNAKGVYDDFISCTKLIWSRSNIMLPNSSGVLHPVDLFIKHFYDRFYPRQGSHAFSKYKRTNPTLRLRLNHLEKYAEPNPFSVGRDELQSAVDSLLMDVRTNESAPMILDEVNKVLDYSDFSGIQIDGSSAAGYPFPPGKKKRDVHDEAVDSALTMLHDDDSFHEYISNHVWYTTGRARMQKVDDDDAGRLIIYAGYSYLLLAMIFLQPWSRFMNRYFDWCAVGFSWMNNGGDKLAKYMMADKGFAPVGFRYVSVDISNWDTKLHPTLLESLENFYDALFDVLKISRKYKTMFLKIVESMISCPILMPLGYMFHVSQGMKSGWAATANDNTLIHEIVFRVIMRRVGYIKHMLYGDDNLMLVPESISDDVLISEYARFGLVVKTIHSSRNIGDVDFLSKHVKYSNGHYYVFRDAVESHSRILMPEEMDPRRRDRPDPVIAAERMLGHLLDNPFNEDVRNVCYDILRRLKRDYGLEYIEVHHDLRKKHPWRFFDPSLIPRKFPVVPSLMFIENLYGVPIPTSLRVSWPSVVTYMRYDLDRQDSDSLVFDSAASFANDVAFQVSELTKTKMKSLVRKISPYKQPVRCYGFHAARFEFAIKYFSIRFNNLLDLGSHPGACAASAAKYCEHIVCVSLKPKKDVRDFCPYVVRDSSIKRIVMDANNFDPHTPFDLQHDDVDIVGSRSVAEDIEIGLGMIFRARKNVSMVEQCLFTIKEVDWRVKDKLYDLYKDYGHIDFVKPLFSNPWKPEIMVYVKKTKNPRMRRALFIRQFNAFLNSLAPMLFEWNELLISAVSAYEGVHSIPKNPFQTDEHEEAWIIPWIKDS